MPSKAVELRELPDDELYVRIESAKEELFNLRFQLATGQLDNTARLKELRHDVARLATVLREREIELELDKIAVVRIDRQVRHPLYGKTVRRSSKLAAHDEQNDAHFGDTVRITETRPVSKTKRWRVVEVVERAK